MSGYFSLSNRGTVGHWDVSDEKERAFRIRGEPGDVVVHDERQDGRPFPRENLRFRTVNTAVAWIADEMMQEAKP